LPGRSREAISTFSSSSPAPGHPPFPFFEHGVVVCLIYGQGVLATVDSPPGLGFFLFEWAVVFPPLYLFLPERFPHLPPPPPPPPLRAFFSSAETSFRHPGVLRLKNERVLLTNRVCLVLSGTLVEERPWPP